MGNGGYSSIIMIILMLVIFYLFLILPENKKKKKLNEMRSSLKVGDDIVTIGGMMGKVVHVTDDSVTFETSEDRFAFRLPSGPFPRTPAPRRRLPRKLRTARLPSRKQKKRKRKSRSTRSRRAPRCKAAFGMIHPLQEYAVMHMFCRGCFFAYGTKMAAAALTRGSLRLDRSRADIDAELAGGVCGEPRAAA